MDLFTCENTVLITVAAENSSFARAISFLHFAPVDSVARPFALSSDVNAAIWFLTDFNCPSSAKGWNEESGFF